MKWTKETVDELEELIIWLKKNTVGEVLEKFANFYIRKHGMDMDKYLMDFSDNVPGSISNGAYKLAFICDAINERYNSSSNHVSNHVSEEHAKREEYAKGERKHKEKKRKFKNVYECLAHIIKFGLSKKFKIDINKMGFSQMYLSYIVKEVIFPSSFSPLSFSLSPSEIKNVNISYIEDEIKNPLFDKDNIKSLKDLDKKVKERKEEKEKHKLKEEQQKEEKGEKFKIEVVNVAYFFINEIVKICEKREDITKYLPCLISSSENIDLEILTWEQKRALLAILDTRRTLFIRILLLISYELYQTGNSKLYSNPNWLLDLISFSSFSSFSEVVTSPILELSLAITTHYF